MNQLCRCTGLLWWNCCRSSGANPACASLQGWRRSRGQSLSIGLSNMIRDAKAFRLKYRLGKFSDISNPTKHADSVCCGEPSAVKYLVAALSISQTLV